MTVKRKKPIGPGEILKAFLQEYNLTQVAFAHHLGWTTTKVNQLIRGKLTVTPATAYVLGDAFGNSPAFWLNAQMARKIAGKTPFQPA